MKKIFLDQKIIKIMIEIGNLENLPKVNLLSKLRSFKHSDIKLEKYGDLMRTPEFWRRNTKKLTQKEIIGLIKFCTVAEGKLEGWNAGSVSPVISLFEKLNFENEQERENLINWILKNTNNPFIPFSNKGAKSYSEYLERLEEIIERRRFIRAREEERERKSKEQKAKHASFHIFKAIQRKDIKAVKALVKKGANLNDVNEKGQTPLELAKKMNLIDIIKSLRT